MSHLGSVFPCRVQDNLEINGWEYSNWTHIALFRETWHLSQAHIFTLMLILQQKASHLPPQCKVKSTFKWRHCKQYSPGKLVNTNPAVI